MQLEIGVIGAIVGMLITYLTFNRNRDRDVRSSATEDAVVRTKLDHIGSGVDSIRVEMEVSKARMSELTGTVIRVEESTKQAHKRIDSIEEKGGNH